MRHLYSPRRLPPSPPSPPTPETHAAPSPSPSPSSRPSQARHTPRRPTPGQDALSRAVSQLQRESEVTMALETESASVNQQLALQVASLQRYVRRGLG